MASALPTEKEGKGLWFSTAHGVAVDMCFSHELATDSTCYSAMVTSPVAGRLAGLHHWLHAAVSADWT